MKASILELVVAVALLQFAPTQQTPPRPQIGQRGQEPTPAAAQRVPLNASECKCFIEVTVKHPGTGEPISDIDVSINEFNASGLPRLGLASIASGGSLRPEAASRAFGPGSGAVTIMTDSSGRAVFRDLAEGTYVVQAAREGYFGVAKDAYLPQANASIDVGPGNPAGGRGTFPQPVQKIALNMVQGVTLSGSIIDANRRPASALQVGAYQVTYQDGHRVITQTGTAVQTDDRGEYRMFWFPPGEYYIRTGTSGSAAGFRGARAGNAGTNSQIASYYPGTTDAKSALPVVVHEGSNLTGLNIALQDSTGVTVSGTILNTVPGGRVLQGQVIRSITQGYLVPRNPYFWETPASLSIGGALRPARGGTSPNDSETPFEIRNVTPGTYDFYPVFNSADVNANAATARTSPYLARTTIEVGLENITGIQSVIRAGTDLKGHVTVAGNPASSASPRAAQPLTLENIRIQFQSKDNLPPAARTALTAMHPTDTNGAFNLLNLVEGRYFVSGVPGLPMDAYVSDIRQDSRSVFDENNITTGKEAQSTLEIDIRRGGATIQGVVQDAKRNPVPAVQITLIPDMPRRQNVLLYKSANSDEMGKFNLDGIAPGNYKLYAWEHIPARAEQNAEFMREYDALGVSVVVAPGLPLANVLVPLIPAKR